MLLAVRYHLTGPTVVVAVLGGVPTLAALYLAWAALPGAISSPEPVAVTKPAFNRLARQWDPVELGVHQVTGGGPMPTYVRRPHDELLWAVLDPAVPASRLVVVRGGSSTGKTRAAYEAVVDRFADWWLDYPLNPSALAARLTAGIPARTVLWLGELRQYADADGGAEVLGRLADLLQGEDRLVITTVWPEHWGAYIAAARAGPGPADPAGTAGRLLERLPQLTGSGLARIDPGRGGVIDVPDGFTAADLEAAASTGDPVLAEAAAAAIGAGQAGQVTQFLAGVPDLLDRYAGVGGDPYGQAVIIAAMDAARLGHASPLPAALVQEAAVGYLSDTQRTKDLDTWRDTALAWAAEELNGAVRALKPVPPSSGTGVAGYRAADYLDQHGRRTRQDQLGPSTLWDALTVQAASAGDLTRLGQAARDRGLYRHAAALWGTAATLGSIDAARQLIAHLGQVSPDDTSRAARWVATHANLDDPQAVAGLLGALCEAGAGDAVAALADRAATQVSLDDPLAIASLLRALRKAGASVAVTTLLARDPAARASLDRPWVIEELLGELCEAGAGDAVAALADRAATQVSLDSLRNVAVMVWALRTAGADAAAHALAGRAASQASLDDPRGVASLLDVLCEARDGDAVTALLARDPVAHASLDDIFAVSMLLEALRQAGADDAVAALASRAAARGGLNDPQDIARLLNGLRKVGARDAVAALASRAVGQVSLDDPQDITELLMAAGAREAVTTLANRAAAQVSLDDPQAIAGLLKVLRAAGANDAVAALASRAAAQVSLDDPQAIAVLLRRLWAVGADEMAQILISRVGTQARPDDPQAVEWLLRTLRVLGPDAAIVLPSWGNAVAALASRAAAQASLDDPLAIAELLSVLDEAGDEDAVTILLARDPAAHTSLDDLRGVAELLGALCEAGARDAVSTLANRAAACASLHDPFTVAELLGALREAGARDAIIALANRATVQVSLDDRQAVAELLSALDEAGIGHVVRILATRAANAGMFELFLEVRSDEAPSYLFGREPDETPSQSWNWQEPTDQDRGLRIRQPDS